MESEFKVPAGWARRHCPECKIRLVVRKTSKDYKRCALCMHEFVKPKKGKNNVRSTKKSKRKA